MGFLALSFYTHTPVLMSQSGIISYQLQGSIIPRLGR